MKIGNFLITVKRQKKFNLSEIQKHRLEYFSINEIERLCNYAIITFESIFAERNSPDEYFILLQSYLSHCANLSKFLNSKTIAVSLGKGKLKKILNFKPKELNKRWFRNSFEHYDERLVEWISKKGDDVTTFDTIVGPRNAISISEKLEHIYIRYFIPNEKTFIFIDNEIVLEKSINEVKLLQQQTSKWLQSHSQVFKKDD